MITRLTGQIERVDGLSLVIGLPGGALAYQVLVPAYLAERLAGQVGQVGQPITLSTLEYLESQGQGSSFIPRLVGFQTDSERRFFELLTTVKGIGNRKALRAMSIEPARIAAAIQSRDTRALTQLPEIGKRMAETVVAELSGKVAAFLTAAEVKSLHGVSPYAPNPLGEDAVEALQALGESRGDAETLVARAAGRAAQTGRTLDTVESILDEVYAHKR